jgi:hypothetical protein
MEVNTHCAKSKYDASVDESGKLFGMSEGSANC